MTLKNTKHITENGKREKRRRKKGKKEIKSKKERRRKRKALNIILDLLKKCYDTKYKLSSGEIERYL